jgi:hypothetical protein
MRSGGDVFGGAPNTTPVAGVVPVAVCRSLSHRVAVSRIRRRPADGTMARRGSFFRGLERSTLRRRLFFEIGPDVCGGVLGETAFPRGHQVQCPKSDRKDGALGRFSNAECGMPTRIRLRQAFRLRWEAMAGQDGGQGSGLRLKLLHLRWWYGEEQACGICAFGLCSQA